MHSFYDVLGVLPAASAEEIKSGYRKAAMRWHPDRNLNDKEEAERKFKELAHAYSVLGDVGKRKHYDESLRRKAPHAEQSSGAGQESAADVFFAAMVELALELAARGYNRDVLFGALLSQGCPDTVAHMIVDHAVSIRKGAAESEASARRHRPDTRTSANTQTSTGQNTDKHGHTRPNPEPPASTGPTADASSGFSWTAALLLMALVFGLYMVFRSAPRYSRPLPSVATVATTQSIARPIAPPSAPAQPPRRTLADLLRSRVADFNESTGTGSVTYASLPASKALDGYRSLAGQPHEFALIQTVPISEGPQRIIFFSSTLKAINGEAYSCHACAPLLSAMLVSETASGLEAQIALQPLEPVGSWGSIPIDGDFTPAVVQVAPGKMGFILLHHDQGQGNSAEWGTVYSIEKRAFKRLGAFEIHSDAFGEAACDDGKRKDCEQNDVQVRFVKAATESGYFDLAATGTSVKPKDGTVRRFKSKYVLHYDGNDYVKQAPSAVQELMPDGTLRDTAGPAD